MSPRTAARTAGFGYLVIIALAVFAEFFVRSTLVVPGDAATTAANIAASERLFRAGVVGYLGAAIADVVVAMALYVFLKPVNASLALLAAWFRLMHATILGIALNHLLGVLPLLHGAGGVAGPVQDQVMWLLNSFNDGWLIGLVFFGLHCLVLGYLMVRSADLPKLLGVLLIAAGVGYLIDSLAHFLLPDYHDFEAVFLLIVAVPAFIAELALCLWLLWRGGKVQRR